LNVFKELRDEGFAFKLYIAGDGPLYEQYATFIKENNLQDKVCMSGHLDYLSLKKLYRQADFLVQAPIAEGYGKAPVEGFFFMG